MTARRSALVDSSIRAELSRARVPGFALGLARAGRPTLLRGFGERDRELHRPESVDTVHGLASVTKSFTALAVLRLADEGRLSVQDPVRKYLPGYRTPRPDWSRRTTVHHFLTHTTGLPPLPALYYEMVDSLAVDFSFDAADYRRAGIDLREPPIHTFDEMLQYLAHARYRPLGPPGSVFSYSNEAFGLLGAVVEAASGETYERYVEEAILRPAGMTRTTFDTGVMQRFPEVATLYTPVRRGTRVRVVAAPIWHESSVLRASGGLRSTARDMLRYLEVYRTGGRVGSTRIVSAHAVQRMTTPHVATEPGSYYGYGLSVTPVAGVGTYVGHGGSLKGVASAIAVVPEWGVTGVALSNLDGAPSGTILREEVNRLLGRPRAAPLVRRPALREPPRTLGDLVGLFGSGEGWWLRTRVRRGRLLLDFLGIEITGRGLEAVPIGPDLFRVGRGADERLVHFRRSPSGRVEGLDMDKRVVRRRTEREWRRLPRELPVW